MNLTELNNASHAIAHQHFLQCCASQRWADRMVSARPFTDKEHLLEESDRLWSTCNEEDFLQAFQAHPRIGNIDSLRQKYANTRQMASNEQAGVSGATDEVLQALAEGNRAYEEKFGYIFIVCATGKSAGQMLDILHSRLPNIPTVELPIAAAEQHKITQIRLQKMLHPSPTEQAR